MIIIIIIKLNRLTWRLANKLQRHIKVMWWVMIQISFKPFFEGSYWTNVFQKWGASTAKAWSPAVKWHVRGTVSTVHDAECSVLCPPHDEAGWQGMERPYYASSGKWAHPAWSRSAVNSKPVEVAQKRDDVLKLSRCNHTCRGVHHRLELVEQVAGQACQRCVAEVQTR